MHPAPLRRPLAALVLAAALVAPGLGCSSEPAPVGRPVSSATTADPAAEAPAARARRDAGRLPTRTRVLAISVDGLSSAAVRRLGARRTPTLHRLLRDGAGTLNARSSVEQTITLPNHTSMLTGRRIDARRGGHGVTWNTHRPGTTVHDAAGERVSSVFTSVAGAGGRTALFTGKEKFSLFPRSWPGAVDRYVLSADDARLTRAARRDLVRRDRALTFLHLATPDVAGHASGFGSRRYLRAVRRADALLGHLVRTIRRDPALRRHLVVVLTADHGGAGSGHGDRSRLANYRVPFLVWGAGVADADLYRLNPQRRDPGARRPAYGARNQPVRNGDVANLVTSLLDLPPVPGSRLNRRQDLRVLR